MSRPRQRVRYILGMEPAHRLSPRSLIAVATLSCCLTARPAKPADTVVAPYPALRQPGESRTLSAIRNLDAPAALRPWLELGNPQAFADTTLPRLGQLSSDDRLGLALRLQQRDVPTRVATYAFLQVGTPYELGPLGEAAPPDTQPVLAFRTTDCTTINLVSAALAHAIDATGELPAMARSNYRGGFISYATRFHFTTDRLDSSPWFRDITRRAGGDACKHQWVTLNQRADGSHWIPIDWTRRREVFYVPRESGAEFERWFTQHRIPAAMGIAFVKASKLADGLDVVHESMLWQGRTLLHASSLSGRVVTLPWRQFLEESGSRYDGFVLFEYR